MQETDWTGAGWAAKPLDTSLTRRWSSQRFHPSVYRRGPARIWMRHLDASHAIAGGMPIEIAQQSWGHAPLATTIVYVTTEKRQRLKAAFALDYRVALADLFLEDLQRM